MSLSLKRTLQFSLIHRSPFTDQMAEHPHNSETLSTYSNKHSGCSQYHLKDSRWIKLETHKDPGQSKEQVSPDQYQHAKMNGRYICGYLRHFFELTSEFPFQLPKPVPTHTNPAAKNVYWTFLHNFFFKSLFCSLNNVTGMFIVSWEATIMHGNLFFLSSYVKCVLGTLFFGCFVFVLT